MYKTLIDEFARNMTGYFLIIVGLSVVGIGLHFSNVKLSDSGTALITSSLLAFQIKPPLAQTQEKQ